MSETLPTQTHFDRMCQQLCTYYVHTYYVCVRGVRVCLGAQCTNQRAGQASNGAGPHI